MVFPPLFLCVSELVSRPGMPSLLTPIDPPACSAMKQPDHLARALLLSMLPKCLAQAKEKNNPIVSLYFYICVCVCVFVYVKVHSLADVFPALFAL